MDSHIFVVEMQSAHFIFVVADWIALFPFFVVRLAPAGKVEIILQKTNRGQHWMTVGKPLDGNNSYVKTSETSK